MSALISAPSTLGDVAVIFSDAILPVIAPVDRGSTKGVVIDAVVSGAVGEVTAADVERSSKTVAGSSVKDAGVINGHPKRW